MIAPGPLNAITDVPGIRVGHAEDRDLVTGTTVVIPEAPAIAAAEVSGGAPGTRGVSVLDPASVMTRVDAVCLSGGSAYGLDACGGAMAWLRGAGRGFAIGDVRVPIVPGAIIFDLLIGERRDWDRSPWWDLGHRAAGAAAPGPVAMGTVGAGMGATADRIKGGVGTASFATGRYTVGALAVANPLGTVVMPGSKAFWAWSFEQAGEFGGVAPHDGPVAALDHDFERVTAGANTTIAVVATDLALDRDEARRVAVMAQDGFARAIRPVHSPLDGDTVFVLSTGRVEKADPVADVARAGMLAADCVARAIARGVYEATSIAGVPAWRDLP